MKIAILGAGAWGSALAITLNDLGHDIWLWDYFPDWLANLQTNRANPHLDGVIFPEQIKITANLEEAVTDAEVFLLAASSKGTRLIAKLVNKYYQPKILIVNASKGFEVSTGYRMSQVIGEEIPNIPQGAIVTISGPSLAIEVAKKIPTTVVAASWDINYARQVQKAFMTSNFRIYTTADLIGVEIGGSLKNIIAIAAGILDGYNWGQNTKGALMTRGLTEITRLGVSLGGHALTFAGLSGMGDMITTCESKLSRNRYVGEQLAKNKKLAEILESMAMVVEGVDTTKIAYEIAKKERIEMPITQEMHAILFEDKNPKKAVIDLMTRSAKAE